MVKARAITQQEIDDAAAAEAAEREQNEAIETIKGRQVTLARLTLALTTVLWPKLTAEERQQIRDALPDADEQALKAALAKL